MKTLVIAISWNSCCACQLNQQLVGTSIAFRVNAISTLFIDGLLYHEPLTILRSVWRTENLTPYIFRQQK